MLQHGREIAPSVSWEILVHVKRTGGISVNELAALLKMSYMGVKQHCDALKRRGYLDTWRRPKATGRPEKIFRPTVKLDLVLPNWGNELCFNMLAFSAQVLGETAPDRLLHSFLQQKAEQWAAKIKGKTLAERAKQFVKIRNSEGWMSDIVQEGNQLRIVEHHSPLSEIARIYPAVWTIETRALEHCFEGEVIRQEVEGQTYLILPGEAPVGEFPASAPAAEPVKIKTTAGRKAEKPSPPVKTATHAPIVPVATKEQEPEPEPEPITEPLPPPAPVQTQEPVEPPIAVAPPVYVEPTPASPPPPAPAKSSSSKKRNEPQGLLFGFD
ncbi:winged helix-turn-helix transcriptional regulator [Phragmitibacter flavus]|uniref:Winged helix-turn-helix transcriptional regulator n=1 Tax=Phragmitibacter flavus TaxID=2576071 RepID=A0A5R8KGS6_9BACT|nr:winged helix-turn-helix transcriptional regulator [Phragmitibacter flavus]TLD71508.1 winged helix-turn-helix transcriptional regulator [Phragmitibacter flavus]